MIQRWYQVSSSLYVGNDGFEDSDSGDIDKENVSSKLSLNNSPNQSHMRMKLDVNRISRAKGNNRFQNISKELVTPVTKKEHPPSRMTYVDAVRKGTHIRK